MGDLADKTNTGPGDGLNTSLGENLRESPLSWEHALQKRWTLLDAVVDKLHKEGFEICGWPDNDRGRFSHSVVLNAALNAWVPEYFCDLRAEHGADERAFPPNVKMQQDICRYLRGHPELKDSLAEAAALTLYAKLGVLFCPPSSMILYGSLKSVIAGNRKYVLPKSGTIFIPGCGLRDLEHALKSVEDLPDRPIKFLLCDNHPFVSLIGGKFNEIAQNDRISFLPCSMEDVTIPKDTSLVLLSYVEGSGKETLERMMNNLFHINRPKILTLAANEPHEYGGLDAKGLRKIIREAGFEQRVQKSVPSISTHIKREGKSVDFLDLSESEALSMFHGDNGIRTNSVITKWR